ncbi:MAG: ribbon-helix-helix protein, CopG family [Chloroflexota bacterium]|nr:ribbon-helix-helix protein, CopG family [Chloroflexota bacterium]MDE2886166.1 ribbon-helix-helix protein, CopG family [Chloroflexota bacterium]
MSVRLEVRLDEKRRAQLEEIAGNRGASISEVVRALIDDAYEEIIREDRRRAVQELITMNVEEMPDPEELARQLNNKYEPADYRL